MYNQESINNFLSNKFKNTEAMELLIGKLETFPYDYLKLVRYSDSSYNDIKQGAKIDYRVDDYNYRDITAILDVNDGLKKIRITLEIKNNGNDVYLITKSPKEDSTVFSIKYSNDDNSINVVNKRAKFYRTNKEELVDFIYSKFDEEGSLIDFKIGKGTSNRNRQTGNKNYYNKRRR